MAVCLVLTIDIYGNVIFCSVLFEVPLLISFEGNGINIIKFLIQNPLSVFGAKHLKFFL